MASEAEIDELEALLERGVKDLGETHSALFAIVELSGDRPEALPLMNAAQQKCEESSRQSLNYYLAREPLRRKLRSGELSVGEAKDALRAWNDDIDELTGASAAALRALNVFKQLHTHRSSTAQSANKPAKAPPETRLLNPIDDVPLPATIALDSTNRCNFRCVTCPQAFDQTFAPFDLAWIDPDNIEPALRAAENVHVAGSGEPLLSPTGWRMMAVAREAGAGVSMTTNASLLNRVDIPDEIGDDIVIGVSFDGGTRETVETLRRGFDWDRVLDNLRSLPEAKRQRVVLAMTVVRQNHHELIELAAVADEIGLRTISLQQFTPNQPQHTEMSLSRAEWERLQADKRTAAKRFPDVLIQDYTFPPAQDPKRSLEDAAAVSMLADVRPRSVAAHSFSNLAAALAAAPTPHLLLDLAHERPAALREGPADEVVVPYCTSAWSFAHVSSAGTVQPCCAGLPPLGSLREHQFADIWNGEAAVALRRTLLGEGEMPLKCRDCQAGMRFSRAVEAASGAARGDGLVKLRLLFDLSELPENLRMFWDEHIPVDRVIADPLSSIRREA